MVWFINIHSTFRLRLYKRQLFDDTLEIFLAFILVCFQPPVMLDGKCLAIGRTDFEKCSGMCFFVF